MMASRTRPTDDPVTAERTSRENPRVVGHDRHLVAFSKDGAVSYPVGDGDVVVVGRGAESHVRIERPALSRRHFALRGGKPATIEDLGSANGTRVNGRTIPANEATPIEADALIEAGGAFFVLRRSTARTTSEIPHGSAVVEDLATHGVVVRDPIMERLYGLARHTATSPLPVLILGETGVGKELLAAAVHRCSARARMPYLRINCAALPEQLLESELFGYEAGAFTGASKTKQGLIEAADGGTFFFDEIGEMPLTTQAKLLRLLESQEVHRLGGLRPRRVDVRFVAATHRDLPRRIREGTFRRDLYYRLNGMTLSIPPLRQRHGEIGVLARSFAERAAASLGRGRLELGPDAVATLEAHPWPGNVRELKHVIERAVALCDADVLRADHIALDSPDLAGSPSSEASPGAFVTTASTPPQASGVASSHASAGEGLLRVDADAERAAIVEALREAGGNQKRAAEILGISRRTLLRRLDEHALARPRKPASPRD